MILVESNSAHYKDQQNYLNYIYNLKPGDIVYPGSDGKGGRCTACRVHSMDDNHLIVEGVLWNIEINRRSVFYRETGEIKRILRILDQCQLDEDNEIDCFYQLIMFEGYNVDDGYFSNDYLKSLGLK